MRNDYFSDQKDKFSPMVQDKMAVMLIENCCALEFIRKGDIKNALSANNNSLPTQWTSLPGGKQTRHNLPYLIQMFNTHVNSLKNETLKKGPLAGII